MMTDKPRLVCPVCGAEMNRHAMKVDFDVEDPELIDPEFGGVVKEAHYCPQCGKTELVQAL